MLELFCYCLGTYWELFGNDFGTCLELFRTCLKIVKACKTSCYVFDCSKFPNINSASTGETTHLDRAWVAVNKHTRTHTHKLFMQLQPSVPSANRHQTIDNMFMRSTFNSRDFVVDL